jgi:uncharacterized RDD family membrane protein YckC
VTTQPQAIAERVHGAPPPPPVRYEGLVTRALALALDAAVIDLVAAVVGGIVALVFTLLRLGEDFRTVALAIGGALFVLWSVGYFVAFWSTTGQTLGNRALGIRVRRVGDGLLRPRRALLRFVMLTLAAIPLGAGFLPVLFDARRRGIHDMVAGTVVVEAD